MNHKQTHKEQGHKHLEPLLRSQAYLVDEKAGFCPERGTEWLVAGPVQNQGGLCHRGSWCVCEWERPRRDLNHHLADSEQVCVLWPGRASAHPVGKWSGPPRRASHVAHLAELWGSQRPSAEGPH